MTEVYTLPIAVQIIYGIALLIEAWWWLAVTALLYFPARFLYRWWITWDVWYREQNWMILEIIPPQEIEKPFRAMEDVLNVLWTFYDSPNWREVWCAGQPSQGFWFSFEIVSFEGEVHFYLRCYEKGRKLVESAFHAHYPDVEIQEAADYTKNVLQDIPNENMDMYGEDYVFTRENAYPIRTYKFFEIRPEEVEEEKRIDPLSTTLEALSKLKKGEQFWFQIVPVPILLDREIPWVKQGKALTDKIARRPKEEVPGSIMGDVARVILGREKEEEKPKEIIPPEMKLTPGEREKLAEIEAKTTKLGFKTYMRCVYLYKKEAYFSPHYKIARTHLTHFATQSLNSIVYWGRTRTRIHYWWRKRRLYTRKKNIFRRYIERFPPAFPDLVSGTMVLNTEELATIFHLPSKAAIMPPGIPRVPAKKGPPPAIPGLPTEE